MNIPLWGTAIVAFIIINVLLVFASVLVYMERRIAAFIQNRVGPNRVGPAGALQPFADVLKLLMKEDVRPIFANKTIHSLAPLIMVTIAMTTIAVLPFGRGLVIADVNVAILMILALTSLSVYGVTLAGWSSNSKYSLLGGLRSSAQMISYELAMGTAVASVILMAGSLNLTNIIEQQGNWWGMGWNVFKNPLAFIIFTVTAFAETNRTPFDLPEAEQELVGGYHTEYSGMKFGMFFMAEYVNMFMASALIATLFFGGYLIPFEPLFRQYFMDNNLGWLLSVLQVLSFLVKAFFFVFLYIWVRWTLPRFKFNQLMTLGWKYLLPLALVNLILVAVGMYIFA